MINKWSIVIIVFTSQIFASNPLSNFSNRYNSQFYTQQFTSYENSEVHVSTGKFNKKTLSIIASLLLPGSGQIIQQAPIWKSALFLGIESLALYELWYGRKQAEDLRNKYESFADQKWDISRWARTSQLLLGDIRSSGYTEVYDVTVIGSHHLLLEIDGRFISSDTLHYFPELGATVVRNRDFYENIGKYDQFVAGWDDALSDWYIVEKNVGDYVEIIIQTPHRNSYLNQRKDSNDLLNRANFAITTIIFNHVFSAIDAWIYSKKMEPKKAFTDKKMRILLNSGTHGRISGISVIWKL
jgi:hypothetical protein